MNLISIFGAGLLVGAALVVIVPEGMLVLFNSMSNLEDDSQGYVKNTPGGQNAKQY